MVQHKNNIHNIVSKFCSEIMWQRVYEIRVLFSFFIVYETLIFKNIFCGTLFGKKVIIIIKKTIFKLTSQTMSLFFVTTQRPLTCNKWFTFSFPIVNRIALLFNSPRSYIFRWYVLSNTHTLIDSTQKSWND